MKNVIDQLHDAVESGAKARKELAPIEAHLQAMRQQEREAQAALDLLATAKEKLGHIDALAVIGDAKSSEVAAAEREVERFSKDVATTERRLAQAKNAIPLLEDKQAAKLTEIRAFDDAARDAKVQVALSEVEKAFEARQAASVAAMTAIVDAETNLLAASELLRCARDGDFMDGSVTRDDGTKVCSAYAPGRRVPSGSAINPDVIVEIDHQQVVSRTNALQKRLAAEGAELSEWRPITPGSDSQMEIARRQGSAARARSEIERALPDREVVSAYLNRFQPPMRRSGT